jgi:hypothetical protein
LIRDGDFIIKNEITLYADTNKPKSRDSLNDVSRVKIVSYSRDDDRLTDRDVCGLKSLNHGVVVYTLGVSDGEYGHDSVPLEVLVYQTKAALMLSSGETTFDAQ